MLLRHLKQTQNMTQMAQMIQRPERAGWGTFPGSSDLAQHDGNHTDGQNSGLMFRIRGLHWTLRMHSQPFSRMPVPPSLLRNLVPRPLDVLRACPTKSKWFRRACASDIQRFGHEISSSAPSKSFERSGTRSLEHCTCQKVDWFDVRVRQAN